MSDTPRTDEAQFGERAGIDFARQLERELNEASEKIEATASLKVELGNRNSEICKLREINAELESAIRSFQTDFERIQWGWDGDCGSSRLAEDLFDSLTKSKQTKP
jgi:hypothetical protein